MGDIDYERLAAEIAAHMPVACPNGMTTEDCETLRDFAHALRSAKATAWATLIRVVVLGTLATLAAGAWCKLAAMLSP